MGHGYHHIADEGRQMNLACKHRQHEMRTNGSKLAKSQVGRMAWRGTMGPGARSGGNLELPEKKPEVVQVSYSDRETLFRVVTFSTSRISHSFHSEQNNVHTLCSTSRWKL